MSALSTSVEARHRGFAGGGRVRVSGFAGPRFGGARMMVGPRRMGFAGPGRIAMVAPGLVWAGRGAWVGCGDGKAVCRRTHQRVGPLQGCPNAIQCVL